MKICVALAGNPNSGKTTLFNELTGLKQHVANYPGVTVEKKEGLYNYKNKILKIIDLPGIYSLTAYSLEEVVSRNFLINDKPNGIINVVDASNIERNLYLSIQLLELGIPTCIALNMIDVAKNNGIEINYQKLSKILGVPIVPIIARSGLGVNKLIEIAKNHIFSKKYNFLNVSYGTDIENSINKIKKIIIENKLGTKKYNSRWLAIKYLEKDREIISIGDHLNYLVSKKIKLISKKIFNHMGETLESYPEAVIADHRYGYITSILKNGVLKKCYDENRSSRSDRIDKILVNRFAGPIIMLLTLAILYHLIFTLSEFPISWCNSFFVCIENIVSEKISNEMIKSLIISGIINGVGSVIGFVPLIMFMFFGISIIEDSGYLSRVSFMMDRIFQAFGLHGNSVMPYIISGGIAGGCAVPGVMASRSLKSPKERIATILTVPFMSCGAKLPIITVLIVTFFNSKKTELMLLITIISWLSALLIAKILRSTIISGKSAPFVMELPPYRFPTFKGLFIHSWERTWQYIKKAGTIILCISIILWIIMSFPKLNKEIFKKYDIERQTILLKNNSKFKKTLFKEKLFEVQKNSISELRTKQSKEILLNSFAGKTGVVLEKITGLAGFDWRINISLLGGFAAKEVIISTLGTIYSLENTTRKDKIFTYNVLKTESGLNSISALSLIIFIMFYSPCSATIVSIVKETSIKWGIFSILFNTILAFILSVLIYQIGSIFRY